MRRELAFREQSDLDQDLMLTLSQFKQRVAQILNVFSVAGEGEPCNFLQKLVRGMPKRLAKCKRQRYGRCGK